MAALSVILSATIATATQAADDAGLEDAVKATYICKFAPFVEWPPSAFGSPSAPITICVTGDDPVSRTVAQAAAGQAAGGRAMAVRQVAAADGRNTCQVVYVSGPDPQRAATLDEMRGAPVLTVTDASAGGPKGIINFVVVENRVRFQVDLALANQAGLTISSKLLSLAVPGGPKS
jgi:hypothetical protein